MGLTQWLAMSSPTVTAAAPTITAEQFRAMDTNKDGVVTLEEQQAWMAQHAAMGAPAPQYRTEYVPQQKTIQRTVMTKQQVPKTVQKSRMIPKFEWEQRIVNAPRVIEVPKVTMVPKTVTVLVPETTNVTKFVKEYKYISIPRAGETTEMYWDQEMEEVMQKVPVQRMRKSMQAV